MSSIILKRICPSQTKEECQCDNIIHLCLDGSRRAVKSPYAWQPHAIMVGVTCLQFRRELAAMTLLSQHRNVLPLLGACMQPDLAALVTPYCPR